ncbi:regulatory protein GemA [Anaerosolibacter sp.]|uniref:regulatory protein GemA n=1 Tax=Anaerosolibacter sp. TaxID=1872527 RepID=UPI0039F09A52
MAKITNGQMRKMYATAKEIGIDNDLLHNLVFHVSGQEHISALTKREAMDVIDALEEKKTGRKKQRGNNRASEEQKNKIRKLEEALGWKGDPKRLQGFMRKFARVEKLDWLTPNQASNLIESLKKVLEREQEKVAK